MLLYNGQPYYYVLNLQGDVYRLVDSTGATVAQYRYDPWGKVLEASGSMAEINPLRYRGYYYDSETGWYYLNSRYYDPAICRFINADGVGILTEGTGTPAGKNLFAYCDNNPVIRKDDAGTIWETAFDVISLGASIADVAARPYDPWAWACLVGDAVDLIPFVTGVGEITKGVRLATKADEVVDAATDVVKTVKKNSSKITSGFEDWLNKGASDNMVYFGIKKGEPQYTGITKQTLDARLSQHNANGKGFQKLEEQFSGLTRNQARAIEQYFIENGPNKLNLINSIGLNHRYYQEL